MRNGRIGDLAGGSGTGNGNLTTGFRPSHESEIEDQAFGNPPSAWNGGIWGKSNSRGTFGSSGRGEQHLFCFYQVKTADRVMNR